MKLIQNNIIIHTTFIAAYNIVMYHTTADLAYLHGYAPYSCIHKYVYSFTSDPRAEVLTRDPQLVSLCSNL